jgi:hypothetical protein
MPATTAWADGNTVGDWNKDPLVERQVEVTYDVHPELTTHRIIPPSQPAGCELQDAGPSLRERLMFMDHHRHQVFLERIAAAGILVLAKAKGNAST